MFYFFLFFKMQFIFVKLLYKLFLIRDEEYFFELQ